VESPICHNVTNSHKKTVKSPNSTNTTPSSLIFALIENISLIANNKNKNENIKYILAIIIIANNKNESTTI